MFTAQIGLDRCTPHAKQSSAAPYASLKQSFQTTNAKEFVKQNNICIAPRRTRRRCSGLRATRPVSRKSKRFDSFSFKGANSGHMSQRIARRNNDFKTTAHAPSTLHAASKLLTNGAKIPEDAPTEFLGLKKLRRHVQLTTLAFALSWKIKKIKKTYTNRVSTQRRRHENLSRRPCTHYRAPRRHKCPKAASRDGYDGEITIQMTISLTITNQNASGFARQSCVEQSSSSTGAHLRNPN